MAREEDCGLDIASRYLRTTEVDYRDADTLDTDTGEPVFLPFRMSCFVISNLIVTAGMLTPGLQVRIPPSYPRFITPINTDPPPHPP
jgi:hypothetical protein